MTEKKVIETALRQADGSAKRAARLLGVGYRTFLRRMHDHGIVAGTGRPKIVLRLPEKWPEEGKSPFSEKIPDVVQEFPEDPKKS